MKIINQHFGGGALSKSSSLESLFNIQVAGQASRLGFTLAEVLVTLGIIGVISAMTLPTLVKNHQRTVYVTQLQKVVNDLSQAADRAITDSNAVNLRESKFGQEGPQYLLKNYLKVAKYCDANNYTDCFASEYKNMNGQNLRLRAVIITPEDGSDSCAVLASGASICMQTPRTVNNYFGDTVISVDVNGKQGPNILGRDLFTFVMKNDDGTIITGEDMETVTSDFANSCAGATEDAYGACFARILNDGWKMDY